MGIFILIILERYVQIKNGLLFGGLEVDSQIKRTIRDALIFIAIYQIMIRMYDKRTLLGLENGILLGLLIAVGSMIFYDFFLKFGFTMYEGLNLGPGREKIRLTGFLSLNSNNAAGLFNVVYGYVLAKTEKMKKITIKYLIFISVIVIGLLIFASKTGFVIFMIITIIYFFKALTSFKKIFSHNLVLIGLSIILFLFFGDYMSERIIGQVTMEDDSFFHSRLWYWSSHINDIYNNPFYLFFGNLEKATYYRSVHNTYLEYLFFAGAVPLIITLTVFFLMYKKRLVYKNNYFYYTPLYSLIALVIIWITGGGPIYYWFILIIASSAGIPKKYNELQINSLSK